MTCNNGTVVYDNLNFVTLHNYLTYILI